MEQPHVRFGDTWGCCGGLPVGFRSGSLVDRLRFVFELGGGAFFATDVLAHSKKDGLIDEALFLERVEVATIYNLAGTGNVLIGWNGDIARRNNLLPVKEEE